MYNLIIPCNLSHIIVPKYCYVSASLAITHHISSWSSCTFLPALCFIQFSAAKHMAQHFIRLQSINYLIHCLWHQQELCQLKNLKIKIYFIIDEKTIIPSTAYMILLVIKSADQREEPPI